MSGRNVIVIPVGNDNHSHLYTGPVIRERDKLTKRNKIMAIIRHSNPTIVYKAPPAILSYEEKQAMAKGRLKASPSARPYRAVTRGGWIQAQAAATQA